MPRGYNKDGTPTRPSFKGREHTPETLLKLSEVKRGNTNMLGFTHSPESRKKMSKSKKGQHSSPATQFKKGQPSPNKGKPRPDLAGNTNGFKKGQVPWNKGLGTISSENELARKSKEARAWRKSVFERDDYTCQLCGERRGSLHADHVQQFAYYPEIRYELSNGRTLCVGCHRGTPTWGRKSSPTAFKVTRVG